MTEQTTQTSKTDGVVVTHVPVWLGLFVVILLVIVFILAGVLIKVTLVDPRGAVAPVGSLKALEIEARDTRDPAVLIELGFEYRKAGMLVEALATFKRALTLDPKNTAAHYHRGAVLLEIGETAMAEEAFWEALRIDPTHATSAKALADLYASRGQYKSLLVAVKPAADANPKLADLQYLLGLGLEKAGDKRGAARAYWNAKERDPSLSEAREGLERVEGEAR